MHQIKTSTYTELYKSCLIVQDWLRNDFDLISTNNIFGTTLEFLRILSMAYEAKELDRLINKENSKLYKETLLNAHAFFSIYKGLSNIKDDRKKLKLSLKKALNAPFFLNEEDSINNESRNIIFELELASRMNGNGLDVFNFDDVSILYNERIINFQCKRIHSKKQVGQNLDRAYQQLKLRFKDDTSRGFIALSIEKIVESVDDVIWKSSQDLESRLNEILNKFSTTYSVVWNKYLDTRLLGIILSYSFSADINQNNNRLTSGQQMLAVCIPNERFFQKTDELLFKEIVAKLAQA